MFIAFEGPDNVGKSTSALALDCAAQPDYNATRTMHLENVAQWNGDASHDPMPHTYDRIDWFSHMVYRLALPGRDWNDDRPRTVFAMPDTHLVVKLHKPEHVPNIDTEEGYTAGQPHRANEMYYWFTDWLMNVNRARRYELFKSVSIIEVVNMDGVFLQRLADHDSPALDFGSVYQRAVSNDDQLLAFLQHVNHTIG